MLIICLVGMATNIGNAQGNCFGATAPQIDFSSSGGTISKTIQHNCSGGRFSVGSKPSWLTVSISGSRVTATAPSYSGAERSGSIQLLWNGSTSGGIRVVQNKGVKPPPPPPCSISGFSGSTFNATGQTKNYTLSYSNCPSNIYFNFKQIVNGKEENLPSWVQVSQSSSTRVRVTFSRNSGTSSRNLVLIGKRQDGGTPGIGGTFVQHCIEKTWYADSDNDGFRDPGSTPQKDCANRGSGWTQNTTVDVCPSEYNTQNKLKNWYRDTDNDGYRDPNGEMRSQCNKPTNGHWTLSTKNDQCPLQPGPGSGTNGCDPDCASGYLRKDGTGSGPPSSTNIPVQFSFSESGGTAWVEMVFPDGSCAAPYNPVFENVPGWLTLTPASGNRIKLVCSAYTTRGGERRTLPPVRVKVTNNVFIGNISVEQDGPPLPCTVSGSLDGTFDENGEELTFPLTYNNCSAQTTTYDLKRPDGSALPDWVTVEKEGPDEITIRLDRNDGQSSRSITVVATGISDSSLSVGGQLTQSCDLRTWYRDKDNDGWADLEVEACSRPTPASWYKVLADIEGTGDCDDDDPSINPGTIWYEDTDGDNYKDPNGQVVEACSPPEGNWTNSPESVDDQCPNQSAPGPGTNGCDPDCASGYLREDGTSTGPPASANIPMEFSFSESGGTAWLEMVFPDGSCASPYDPVFEDVPGWLTLTHESGNRIKLVCSAYTTRGGERRTLPPVKVKVINDVFIGNISVEQDGPPLPCTVSGSLDGTFDENGEELTFPLTYNNCSAQTTRYDLKRPDGSALPDWATVIKDGPDEITIRMDRNDEQSSRTLIVVATGITDPSLSVGGQLTQSCDLQTWYRDKDNDGWAELAVDECSRPVPKEWYKVLADIEGIGDCDDDDPSINPGTTWYEDTDGDNYKDPNGEVVEACSPPDGNWTSDPRTLDDLCPNYANSAAGSNGCNPDCLPFSIDPGIIEFTNQGGTQTATIQIGCTSGYTIEVQPTSYDWLTVSLNGTSLELECDPGTEAKDITLNVRVNGNSGGGLRVKRNAPPPPPSCEANPISNVILGAFADSQSVTVTFVDPSYCNGAIYLEDPYEESIPQWLNIEPSGNTFTLSAGNNDTGTTRTTTLAVFRDDGTGTGATVPLGWSFTITQASCLTEWFLDADGDEHASDQTTACESPGSGWTREQLPVDDCDDNAYSLENTCMPSGNHDALDQNYIYTRTYQQARNTVPAQKFDEGDNGVFDVENDYIQDITYFDGLGRPMQQIGIRQSPKDEKDIVTHMAYDDFGRAEKEWLPFHEPESTVGSYRHWDVEEATKRYYKNHPMYGDDFTGLSEGDVNPYSQKEFENSPLNRVLKQAAPGEDWKLIKNSDDHSIEFGYGSNTHDPRNTSDPTKDNVRLFVVDLAGGLEDPALANGGFYTAGELFKNVTRDENHTSATNKLRTTEEFTDKQGRVVLKRTYADLSHLGGDTEGAHDTYYVYNDHGTLSYVLPPKMEASTASLTDINTYMAELGYQYVYDHLNRLVEKQLPGKGREYIIYNKLDQPVMTQDANQRANHEWLFTKYDAFGRVAYTGLYTHTGSISRADMQSDLDGHYMDGNGDRNGTAMYEERDNANAANYKYTNNTFPTADLDILTVNYYDDYDFDRAGTGETATALGVANDPYVKGLATGSKVKVLDPSAGPGQADWITTVNYYDAKGRPIYTYSHNTYLGTTDIVETQLDFIGRPVKVRTGHTRNGVTIVTIDNFSYDHVGRLLAQTQCIGDGTLGDECPAVGNLDADLLWDGLGTIDSDTEATQSITVRDADIVPGTDGTTLRIVDDGGQELIVYNNYDELGQLVHNKVGGTPGSGYSETEGLQEVDYTYNVRGWTTKIDGGLFDFDISYNNVSHGGTPLYNGNISETQWRTASDNVQRWYSYGYDPMYRVTSATNSDSNYSLGLVEYDKGGNITRLTRNGHRDVNASTFGLMDDLTFQFNGNQLKSIDDAVAASAVTGFVEGAENVTEYQFDTNGNMTRDDNKKITSVEYNHLNMPTKVTVTGADAGVLDYKYSADGTKLRKIKTQGGVTTTTDYMGNYVYENGNLKQITHPEGYIEPDGNGWQYVYRYTDIWNNTRLTYADDNGNGSIDPANEIRKEQNYYPFGLEHKGYNTASYGVENDLKTYQGQEFTRDLGLNIHEWKYRVSDPTTGGRFWQIDPLAEQYSYQSPYNFSENDPVSGVELEGLEKLHVTVYNVIKNNSGGYTRSAPQMTSVTDNHDWKGTRYESQFNVFGDDNKTVTAIHTGPEAGLDLSRSGVEITEIQGVDLSMGEILEAASNNEEFQEAGETMKNVVAAGGFVIAGPTVAAGRAGVLTYAGLAGDANVLLGGEEGNATDGIKNEKAQGAISAFNILTSVGTKNMSANVLTTTKNADEKAQGTADLLKAIWDFFNSIPDEDDKQDSN